ncbi:MAG: MerR family transcriptional regulator [Anaerovoracaceae bacterium]
MVKASAAGDFNRALLLAEEYLNQMKQERANAEEAIRIVKQILSGGVPENSHFFRRKEVSEYLGISMDALRNWERNGLLTVKRKQNGYRVYTDADIQRLKIIRSLRCANYSLESILRMLRQLSENPDTDIKAILNTPKQDADIISVCDRLIVSLSAAEKNAYKMISMLQDMKIRFL